MNKHEIEKALAGAVEEQVPDVFEAVCKAEPDPRPVSAPGSESAVEYRKVWLSPQVSRIIAAAACFALVVCAAALLSVRFLGVDSNVMLDVNPSVRLSLNRGNRVVKAEADNADAEAVLADMDLRKTDVKVAVNAIIGSMVRLGYLDQDHNTVMITLAAKDDTRKKELFETLDSCVSQALDSYSITPVLINQTPRPQEESAAASAAAEYDVSYGKALLISRLQEKYKKYSGLEELDLADMTLTEIVDAVRDIGDIGPAENFFGDDFFDDIFDDIDDVYDDDNDDDGGDDDDGEDDVSSVPESSADRFIGEDEAKAKVLARLDIGGGEPVGFRCELERDDGKYKYEVEFSFKGRRYEFEVDAETGAILKMDQDPEEPGTSSQVPEGLISEDEARAKAMAGLEIGGEEAAGFSCELEHDNGKYKYDIEFRVKGRRYEIEVDAKTGMIIKMEQKPSGQPDHEETSSGAAESGPAEVSGELIGREAAKAAAMRRSGITEKRLVSSEIELERENGRLYYDITLRTAKFEFECDVDALTGEITEYEWELRTAG